MPQVDNNQHDVGEYFGSWIERPKPLCEIIGPEHCLLKGFGLRVGGIVREHMKPWIRWMWMEEILRRLGTP